MEEKHWTKGWRFGWSYFDKVSLGIEEAHTEKHGGVFLDFQEIAKTSSREKEEVPPATHASSWEEGRKHGMAWQTARSQVANGHGRDNLLQTPFPIYVFPTPKDNEVPRGTVERRSLNKEVIYDMDSSSPGHSAFKVPEGAEELCLAEGLTLYSKECDRCSRCITMEHSDRSVTCDHVTASGLLTSPKRRHMALPHHLPETQVNNPTRQAPWQN